MNEILETDVYVSGDDGVCEYRIPALITTTAHTLIAVCDARIDRPGDAINNIDQVCKRSTDGGLSWSPLVVVAEYPGEEAAADPSLLQDGETGRIWLFYAHIPGEYPNADGPSTARRILRLTCVWSDNDGLSWSPPRNISAEIGRSDTEQISAGPGRGIQTQGGRLIVPCTTRDRGVANLFSVLVMSDDHGESWRISPRIDSDIVEPTIVELQSGDYMVNARSYRGYGCRAIVTSADHGATWSDTRDDETLVEPICQGSLLRHPDGRLLFSNPASPERGDRRNMTVRLSEDEGSSWRYSREVYPGPSRYSCLTVPADGSVGLLYERDSFAWGDLARSNRRISFLRFPIEWITG